jgi:hypothetical protein
LEFDIPWDEIQQKMRENIELVVDEAGRTLKILVKAEMPEGTPIKDMVKDDAGLKQMTTMLMGEEISFTSEILEDERGMLLHFEDDESLKKMHEFLDGLFFGDKLKELMDKIMSLMFEAFGGEEDSNS